MWTLCGSLHLVLSIISQRYPWFKMTGTKSFEPKKVVTSEGHLEKVTESLRRQMPWFLPESWRSWLRGQVGEQATECLPGKREQSGFWWKTYMYVIMWFFRPDHRQLQKVLAQRTRWGAALPTVECALSLKGGAVKDSSLTPVPGLGLLFDTTVLMQGRYPRSS